MIFLKKMDAIVQTVILVLSLVLVVGFDNSWWMFGYFLLGGWQLLSTVITRLFATHLPSVFHRDYYIKTLLVIAVLGLLMFVIPAIGLFYFYGLLFIGPVMAVWYMFITWFELHLWQRRSLIHLK
jgi:hypothetical protein